MLSMYWCVFQDTGGAPVSNYIVEKQDVKTGKWEKCTKFCRNTFYEPMGLDEGHKYKFRVMAENEYGVSEPLDCAKPITAENQFSK